MSSPYLTIVTKKLGALSDDMRLYFDRVINNVETLKAFQHRENLAYIILSQAIDTAPKELTKTVPEQAYTTHLARYLHEHEDHHARLMHSSQFLVNPTGVGQEIAAGFIAIIAEDMLQQYAMGTLEIDEPETYAFRWPFYSETDFPYEDKSAEETAEEAAILDRLEATLAKIQAEKDKK
ncbi:hypothetical protein [Curvivirga aplysinae]|uniref:hypothetical protein n=1 Tax=Curvivirga aplysinae TaxID=2529852 RepID=UPI0012BC4743|nr:hypothetical protein [Curvivirga aplysinae]MTI08651.1 hypothetical protein [Curvivirga aplysinae]